MRKRDGLSARERRQFEELVRIFMEFDSREPSPHHQHPSQWRAGPDQDRPDLSPADDLDLDLDLDFDTRPASPWTRWRRHRRH